VQPLTAGSLSWQQVVADSITNCQELLSRLQLTGEPGMGQACRQLSLRVPATLLDRIRPGDRHDPVLLQVLPATAENQITPGFSTDPLGETAAVKAPCLLHRYQGRALLIVTGACPVHCRYCFRRYLSFPADGDLGPALDWIAAEAPISEVILSGGDPLMADDTRLAGLAEALAAMPHLQRLRVHSRMPVVVPQRVTAALLTALTRTRLEPLMVLHVNHANEVDEQVAAALARLRSAGIILLNQSVLLRGVNDSAQALHQLSERLLSCGVLPYYLHLLDRVQGAAHFEVDEAAAAGIIAELIRQAPGYMVPRLVRERDAAKIPVQIPC
jgi:EF-P beta-lysylation protein EpmB